MNRKSLRLCFILLLLGTFACEKNEPVPAADFSFSGDHEFHTPCTILFENHSVNGFSFQWNFGDDSLSTQASPTHLYPRPGTFMVTLRAYTESREQWSSCRKLITIKPSN